MNSAASPRRRIGLAGMAVALGTAFLASSTAGAKTDGAWTTHRDAAGFSLQVPAGWQVLMKRNRADTVRAASSPWSM